MTPNLKSLGNKAGYALAIISLCGVAGFSLNTPWLSKSDAAEISKKVDSLQQQYIAAAKSEHDDHVTLLYLRRQILQGQLIQFMALPESQTKQTLIAQTKADIQDVQKLIDQANK